MITIGKRISRNAFNMRYDKQINQKQRFQIGDSSACGYPLSKKTKQNKAKKTFRL